jgi:2-C-methyl-D-erythritol 2,4-cyclodiphosphate synthase
MPTKPRTKSPATTSKSASKAPKTSTAHAQAQSTGPALPFRIGHGYDLHRLEPLAPEGTGRPFVLGGILLRDPTFTRGPVAHSDGDVLLHAVTDALLGALALPDIGQLFPDTAKAHQGQDSADFLLAAKAAVLKAGYRIGNLDCTVILQRPKLSPVKGLIREKIAKLLDIPMDWVNLKGKTHEQVDAVGESRAVEAHVVVVLFRDERGQ